MSRDIAVRVKAGPGPWQRFSGTPPITVTGFDPETLCEIMVGDGTLREATTAADASDDQLFFTPASLSDLTARWASQSLTFTAGPPPRINVPVAGSSSRRFWSLDGVGEVDLSSILNGQFYYEYEFPDIGTDGTPALAAACFRGAGSAGNETGWVVRHLRSSGAGVIDMFSYASGTSNIGTGASQAVGLPEANVRYCMLVEANGDLKRARAWKKSDTEPGWLVSLTNTQVGSAGRLGIHAFQTPEVRYYCIGVGLNGQSAPRSA